MIKLGKIIGTFGIKGELKIYPLTNYKEMFLDFEYFFIANEKDPLKVDIVKARIQKNTIIVLLEGINSINQAQEYIGKDIFIEESTLPKLDESEEYVYKLLGMKVYLENNDLIGSISNVFDNGAHGIYEIKDDSGKEILIPVLDDTIVSRDFEEGNMVVRLLPGLLD